MNIILLSRFCKKRGSIKICAPRAALWGGLALSTFSALLLWGGYQYGVDAGRDQGDVIALHEVQRLLHDEQAAVREAKAEQRAHLDALALRIASIQVHLMRLDALGERLVAAGKLDAEEFDFSQEPAVGGVEEGGLAESQSATDLSADMERLTRLLSDREQKLALVESLLMNRQLLQEILPSGRPLKNGWMSSGFGKRTDPFTGKKTTHRGIDFAGKSGSDVVAVAAGIVTKSEKVAGFGNVVEIRHPDGYETRYAHNKKNLVASGDVVNKGDTIALLGSTGRSSGPHVHFEVHKDGIALDPRKYVR